MNSAKSSGSWTAAGRGQPRAPADAGKPGAAASSAGLGSGAAHRRARRCCGRNRPWTGRAEHQELPSLMFRKGEAGRSKLSRPRCCADGSGRTAGGPAGDGRRGGPRPFLVSPHLARHYGAVLCCCLALADRQCLDEKFTPGRFLDGVAVREAVERLLLLVPGSAAARAGWRSGPVRCAEKPGRGKRAAARRRSCLVPAGGEDTVNAGGISWSRAAADTHEPRRP